MGEYNKRHNRKIRRVCPVCGGRVIVCNRNGTWWVVCEADRAHIKYMPFTHVDDAIGVWNEKANVMTNADLIRSMPATELAILISALYSTQYVTKADPHVWLKWLRMPQEQEVNDG